MTDVFEIMSPGLLTTIQDRGRYGYQAFGIPVSGALDEYAFRVANLLVGNDENAAALEITMLGPTIKVLAPAVIALTGADLDARLNGGKLPTWQAIAVNPKDEIYFNRVKCGCRAYLAVAGGIDVPLVMGSRSTYLRGNIGGLEGRTLRAGDKLKVRKQAFESRNRIGCRVPPGFIPNYESSFTLRVVLGPQDDHFTPTGLNTFLNSEYTVTNEADRMGYRLEGAKIEHVSGGDIISDGIPLGAIQVPGHGLPIVMLADRQTVGGYPKIATVISTDIYRIAQAKPGDKVRFTVVSRVEALKLLRRQEAALKQLTRILSMPYRLVRSYCITVAGQTFECTIEEV